MGRVIHDGVVTSIGKLRLVVSTIHRRSFLH